MSWPLLIRWEADDQDDQDGGHGQDDQRLPADLELPAGPRRTPAGPRGSSVAPGQDRLAWSMQNREAGMASRRAGLMATPQASQVP